MWWAEVRAEMRFLVVGLARFVSFSSVMRVSQSEEVDKVGQRYHIGSGRFNVSEASELTDGSNPSVKRRVAEE
jgi:hypothetical protein